LGAPKRQRVLAKGSYPLGARFLECAFAGIDRDRLVRRLGGAPKQRVADWFGGVVRPEPSELDGLARRAATPEDPSYSRRLVTPTDMPIYLRFRLVGRLAYGHVERDALLATAIANLQGSSTLSTAEVLASLALHLPQRIDPATPLEPRDRLRRSLREAMDKPIVADDYRDLPIRSPERLAWQRHMNKADQRSPHLGADDVPRIVRMIAELDELLSTPKASWAKAVVNQPRRWNSQEHGARRRNLRSKHQRLLCESALHRLDKLPAEPHLDFLADDLLEMLRRITPMEPAGVVLEPGGFIEDDELFYRTKHVATRDDAVRFLAFAGKQVWNQLGESIRASHPVLHDDAPPPGRPSSR